MAALPYMQLYIADYLADTMHLDAEEHGAYILLMFNYWQTGKPLPNDDTRLARIARVANDRWPSVKASLSEFFNVTETEWVHYRIELDLELVYESQSQKSAAGKKSAAAKKARKAAIQEGRQRNGNENATIVETPVADPLQRNGNENATIIDPDPDPERERGVPENPRLPAPKPRPPKNQSEQKKPLGIEVTVERSPDLDQTPRHGSRRRAEQSSLERPDTSGKFRLFHGWQPNSDRFKIALMQARIDIRQITEHQLSNFIGYWSDEERSFTQGQWETKFTESLIRDRDRQKPTHTGPVAVEPPPKISDPAQELTAKKRDLHGDISALANLMRSSGDKAAEGLRRQLEQKKAELQELECA